MFNKPKRNLIFVIAFGLLALTATVTLTQESWFPLSGEQMTGAVQQTD
ncbi:MAG: hypothetical protein OXI67_10665 [Candidatus Poribacteria bacterium]|nr:hypothetical protein [Candidatus Poribacteria bacterium]